MWRSLCGALALIGAAATTPAFAASDHPQIITEDVSRFYRIYDAAGGHPTAEQLDRDYLAPGTAGLHDLARLRNVTGARIASAIAAHPETYSGARRCLAVLPAVTRRLNVALTRLRRMYPEMKSAPVTIAVGRGRPVGITDPAGVTMGLEALCAADTMDPNLEDRFVHTIAHEYGHIQQTDALQALEPGQPGATVLTMSLMEGVGEFTAELVSGGIGEYGHLVWERDPATKAQRDEVEAAFLRDLDKTDLSPWMYNGPGDARRPGDLGYWVGYRIVKAYYARATDKHAALKAIFEMRDPKAFLAESGWTPGGS